MPSGSVWLCLADDRDWLISLTLNDHFEVMKRNSASKWNFVLNSWVILEKAAFLYHDKFRFKFDIYQVWSAYYVHNICGDKLYKLQLCLPVVSMSTPPWLYYSLVQEVYSSRGTVCLWYPGKQYAKASLTGMSSDVSKCVSINVFLPKTHLTCYCDCFYTSHKVKILNPEKWINSWFLLSGLQSNEF